jgi:hypothetical protein
MIVILSTCMYIIFLGSGGKEASFVSVGGRCKSMSILEICAVLGYYATSCCNCLPTFRDNVSVPSSRVRGLLTLEDGTYRLSRNVGTELPLKAA